MIVTCIFGATGHGINNTWYFLIHGRYMHILRGWAGYINPDGCRWIVFGLVTPQDGLVTPQDGLVTPPLWGLCADLS